MTNRGNYSSDSHLPSEDYSFLAPEEKDSWRKIPPTMKFIILKGINRNNKPTNRFNSNKSNNLVVKPQSLLLKRKHFSINLTLMNS